MPDSANRAPTSAKVIDSKSLAKIPLFQGLSQDDIHGLDARVIWRRVAGGEWVLDYQAEGADVYFVLSGLAHVVIVSAGREMILSDIREGEYFGQYSAIDGKPRSAGILAVTDCVVARMSAAVYWETIRNFPSVCERVLKDLVSDIRIANQRAHEQANFDVRKRLCAALLRLSRTTSEGRVVVSPPPTHAEFAARISTHREAVTKTLSALEREGMIERGPSAIVLVDAERLRRSLAADV